MKSVVLMLIFQKMMLPERKEMNSIIFVVNKKVLLRVNALLPLPVRGEGGQVPYPVWEGSNTTLSGREGGYHYPVRGGVP